MAKFVGEPIDTAVKKQIEVREKTLNREDGFISNYVQYKAGGNAWIRAISGVNTVENLTDNQQEFKDSDFTSNEAKKLVLSGGELLWDGTRFVKRSSFNTGRSENRGRYNYTSDFGIRPEAGITGFSIKHKNRFGTVREAEIAFTVWSLEDFNLVEKLYLRPGMTLIVEWGNSSYVTNEDNSFVDVITTQGIDTFFNYKATKDTGVQVDIPRILEENRKASDYNYDAFVGYISNFSWSLREDGGYNCTVRVLSRGAIIESLSVIKGSDIANNGPFARIEEKFFSKSKTEPKEPVQESNSDPGFFESIGQGISNAAKGAVQSIEDFFGEIENRITPGDTDVEEVQRLSLMHFFCYKVEEINIKDLENKLITYDNFLSPIFVVDDEENRDYAGPTSVVGRPLIKEINPLVKELKKELGEGENDFFVAGFDGRTTGDGRSAFRYISLRTFLALINLSFLNSSLDKSYPSFSLNFEDYGKYRTFTNHFSFDPSKVLLPKSPSQPELKATKNALKNFFITEDKETKEVTGGFDENKYADKIPYTQVLGNDTSRNIEEKTKGLETNILNICISTKLIISALNTLYAVEAEPETIDLQTFIRGILNEVNANLGGINELDLGYSDDRDEFFIVDRSLVNADISKKNIPIINITGTANTVRNVSLETKISNALGSQIAISSTSGTGGNLNSNPGLLNYNEGKRDRFKLNYKTEEPQESTNESEESEVDKQEKRQKFFLNVFKAYNKLNIGSKAGARMNVFRDSLFNKIKGEGISRTKEALIQEDENNNKPAQNILPLELSFTMNGISGLKVGQIFKLGDRDNPCPILPDVYKKTGFVITGLDSTIENDKWYTTVRSQTFMLDTELKKVSKDNSGGKY